MKSVHLLVAAIGLAATSAAANAQVQHYPVHPATYVSPNGEYRLHVSPTERHGAGPAAYHLTRRDGTTVWRGSRDFTLLDVTVTDRGEAAGHAYWRGFDGVGEPLVEGTPGTKPSTTQGETRPAASRPAELQDTESRPSSAPSADDKAFIVYLTETGFPKICQVIPRRGESTTHGPPSVDIASVSIDSESDRLTALVRIKDPTWREEATHVYLYRLSTGEALLDVVVDKEIDKQRSADQAFESVFAARAIRGTPLTIVHGMGSDRTVSSRFAAFDLTGRTVWTRVFPDDLVDKDESGRLSLKLHRGRGLLGSSQAKEFTIRTFETSRAITFGVDQARDGTWELRELRSEAFVETPRATSRPAVHSRPALTRVPARVKGEVWLGTTPPSAGEIHDLSELAAAADGGLSFLRVDPSTNEPRFVVVNPASRATRSFALSPGSVAIGDYAPVSKDRWLVVAEDRDAASDRNTLYTYWLDTRTGACEKTSVPPMFASMGIASLGEGRFAVLGTRVENFVPIPRLTVFHEGKAAWSIGTDGPLGLDSPQALCVTSRGEIAVLESKKPTLRFFGASGERMPSIDLAQRWGRAPEALVAMAPDVDGGVIVHDATGTPAILRIRPDGTILASWTPVFDDGQVLRSPVVATPAGQLWTTDGQCLYRLDNAGRIVETLGTRLTGPKLEGVAALAFGPRGEIHALSSTTGAVHTYDPRGEPVRMALPDPADVLLPLSQRCFFAADPAGDVHVVYAGRHSSKTQFVHFDANGTRVGVDRFAAPLPFVSAHRQPRHRRYWLLAGNRILLTDERGSILTTIERGQDERWIPLVLGAAQSGDGSLAVFLDGEAVFDPDAPEQYELSNPRRFLILDNEGRLVKDFNWPEAILYDSRFAFDGKRLAYLTRDNHLNLSVVVVSILDGKGVEFPAEGSFGDLRGVVLPEGLDEAWVYSNTRVLKRYAIDRK